MSLTLFTGNTAPSLTYSITSGGLAFDLTGCTVNFQMRAYGSSTLKVNASATITDAVTGAVQYDWQAADVDTSGEYRGWFSVTETSGAVQDTPEFDILIQDHAEPSSLSYRALCTLEDAKEALQITDTSWDNLVTRLVNAATEEMLQFSNREITSLTKYANPSATEQRRYDWQYYGVGRQVIECGDMAQSPTAVNIYDWNGVLMSTPTVATDVDLFPSVRQPWQPITTLRFRNGHSIAPSYYVMITSRWGFPSIPEDIRNAAIETVRIWFDQVGHRSATSEPDLNAAVPLRNLPPHVIQSLNKYRRPNL